MFILYVAGKFEDRKVINEQYIKILEEKNYKISYNWILDETFVDNKESASIMSNNCINDIKKASVVVIIITDKDYIYQRTTTELGIALGLGTYVYIIDPFDNSLFSKNMFTNQNKVTKLSTLDEFLDCIKK
jgi:nucleoside 2-deoxyribosyltransferase